MPITGMMYSPNKELNGYIHDLVEEMTFLLRAWKGE
jgi:hypothetical protein